MLHTSFFRVLALSSFACITAAFLHGETQLGAEHDSSALSIQSNGSSTLGTLSIQSGADIRFGANAPSYTIGEGHDILLGRSLGPDEAKIRIAVKAPASLTSTDIEGSWTYYHLEVNKSENGNAFNTDTGAIAFLSSGNATFDGETIGPFSISAGRHVILDADGETIDFAINASKDFMVSTSSESHRSSFQFLVRAESGSTTAQMAGTWTLGSFGANFSEAPADFWYDGDSLTAPASGSFPIDGGSGSWTAHGNGKLTVNTPEGATSLSVNQSRSILAYTSSPDQAHEGALILRHASQPDLASLAGSWTHMSFELLMQEIVEDPNQIIDTYHPDGTTLQRRERYTNGKLHGTPAVETWQADGKPTLAESYDDGTITHSLWKAYTDGTLTETTENDYENGIQTGQEYHRYQTDGVTLAETTLSSQTDLGQKTATNLYYENGTLQSHRTTIDGNFDGVTTDVLPNGKLAAEATYTLGILLTKQDWTYYEDDTLATRSTEDHRYAAPTSIHESWNPNGTKAAVQRLEKNLPHGKQEIYDANGNLIEETHFNHAVLHGTDRRWHPGTSQLSFEKTYQNGKLNGPTSFWDADGRLTETQEYENDRKHGTGETTQYNNSDDGRHVIHTEWTRGICLRLEEWTYNEEGKLSTHKIGTSVAANLASPTNATPDSQISESYDTQGRLASYSELKNGLLHGATRIWIEGTLWSDENYFQNKLHGRVRTYSDGFIDQDVNYQHGTLHGDYKTYLAGELQQSGTYVDGLIEGLFVQYSSPYRYETTYLHEVPNGPYRKYQDGTLLESGTYLNGLKTGLWTEKASDDTLLKKNNYLQGSLNGIQESYSAGQLSRSANYLNGIQHGIQQDYTSGILYSSTTYDDGVETGPRYTYHPNGIVQNHTPLNSGLPHGTVTEYYDDGSTKSTTVYEYGLQDGAHNQYDQSGRKTNSGTYTRGNPCGTWTSTSYNSEGVANHTTNDNGTCNSNEDFPITRGIRGRVTAGGVGVANVTIQLGENSGPSTQTQADGSYFLDIGDVESVTSVTLSRIGFPDTTTSISFPAEYTFATKDFTLDKHPEPAITIGQASIAGTYFLRDVSFPVHYSLEAPEGVENQAPRIWLKPDGREIPHPNNTLAVNPGLDANDAGNAGKLFIRSAPGIETPLVQIPTYHITQNPTWADSLGGWKTSHDGSPSSPGQYQLTSQWPEQPLTLGFDRETLGEAYWTVWSSLPVIGSDLGLFDVQFTADATARTDGTGNATFGGYGEVRAADKTLAIEADGKGDLVWNNTLDLANASILLRGSLTEEKTLSVVNLFPVLKPLQDKPLYGKFLQRLNQRAKFAYQIGGGVGGRFPIDTVNNEISFTPTELELSFLGGYQASFTPFPIEVDLKSTFTARATFALEGLESQLADYELFGTHTAELRVFDFKTNFEPIDVRIPGTTTSSLTREAAKGDPSELRLIQPDFLDHGRYARFNSGITLFSSTHADTLPDEVLISNIYPHANPVLAHQDGTSALAYIHYDPSRPAGQSTRLYVGIDSGEGFTDFQPVHSQARSDFNPQLAFLPDGRLVAAWETSQLDQIATDIEQRIAGMEIAWSLYDPNTGSWTTPTLVSNNNYIDHSPLLATSPQGPLLAWRSNSGNELIPSDSHPGQVHTAAWNGNAFATAATIPHDIRPIGKSSLAYDGTNAVFAWSHDQDGDPSTSEDAEIYWSQFNGSSWATPTRITANNVEDSSPYVFCYQNDDFQALWARDSALVHIGNSQSREPQTILEFNPLAPAPQFHATCDAQGRVALLWTDYQNQQSDLHYALYDSSTFTWSKQLALTHEQNIEHVPTFALDTDGKLLAAYLSEDTETPQRDLLWQERDLATDLAITAVTATDSQSQQGLTTLTATTQNLGPIAANSVTVDFYLGDPDNGGTRFYQTIVDLLGGDTVPVTFDTPENTADIYARIDPANTVSETDESNNTDSTALQPIAIAASYFTWDRNTSDENSLTLVGTIANNGATTQTNIPVQIADDTRILHSTTISTLAPGESADITTTLTNLTGTEHRFTLTVDPEQTLAEPDRSDNDFTLLLALRHLKDSDGDGLENAWEQLHFGTLDRDGTGDYDLDGLSDTFEFLIQADPLNPTTTFPFQIHPLPEEAGKVSISFPSELGRLYRLETSTDATTWTTNSLHVGTGSEITIEVSTQASSFYRVLVSLER